MNGAIMGDAKKKRQRTFELQPWCIYCGGTEVATTEDHCPPRSLFLNKAWPVGYVFSSCESCNSTSARIEQVVALLARLDPREDQTPQQENEFLRLLSGVKNNNKGVIDGMVSMSTNQKRRRAKKLGIKPPDGQAYGELPIVAIHPQMEVAVEVFAAKLSKALFYLHTGKILPRDSPIFFNWLTNANILADQNWLDVFMKTLGGTASLQRNSADLSSQFDYKFGIDGEQRFAAFTPYFGGSFGFAALTAPDPTRLRELLARVKKRKGAAHDVFKEIYYPPCAG